MSAREDSIVARRAAPVLASSRVWALASRIDTWLDRREAPLVSAELTPLLSRSVLGSFAWRLLSAISRAVETSQTVETVRAVVAVTRTADRARRIGWIGVAIAVAMAVHLALLAAAPYPYPSRAAFVLPLAILAAAVMAIGARHLIAAALEERSRS